jgi:hypothetical protein
MLRRKPSGETERVLDADRVRRARLRVAARCWLLSKALQRKYGPPPQAAGPGGGDLIDRS